MCDIFPTNSLSKAVKLLLEANVGKDALSLSLPMCLYEPSSHLQLMCESLRHWHLLQTGMQDV